MTTQAARDEWLRKAGPLYPLIVAAKLQTRLLLVPSLVESADDRERAEPYLPVVAGILGALLYVLYRLLAGFGLPSSVCAVLILAASVTLTGAWLEVGLGRAIEQGARMWDPTGQPSAGRVAMPTTLTLLLLVKFATLAHVPSSRMLAALLIVPIASRWSVGFAFRLWRNGGPGREPEATGWNGFLMVSVALGVFVLLFGKGPALLSLVAATGGAAAAVHLTRRYSRAREDWACAAGALTEVLALLAFCV